MVVKIRDVKKHFNGRVVVDGINLDVEEGDLVALIGPSGCGKSTLLRCINGLETIDAGAIQLNSHTLSSLAEMGEKEFRKRSQAVRQQVGMVFQSFNLFPHLTVLENLVKAPCVVAKMEARQAERLAISLLTMSHNHSGIRGLISRIGRGCSSQISRKTP